MELVLKLVKIRTKLREQARQTSWP